MTDTASRRELPRWLWLWLPLVLALFPYPIRATSREAFQRWVRSEWGLVENLTALALLVAVIAGIGAWRRRAELPERWLGAWVALLTLGCIYFLGEEISWGQHLIGWSTPESWGEANTQDETNLHNLGGPFGGLLDQGPRSLLTLAAVVGGILAPLLLGPERRRGVAGWLWPTFVCLPSAVLAIASSLPKKVARAFGGEIPEVLDIKGGEMKELFLALFLMLYLLSIRVRVAQSGRSPAPAGADGSASSADAGRP